ncbi:MAG: hypothetical protein P1U88_03715 [Thalassobaculaceae bacterium]|nr:hypothetical protein [Thalassobaculaceae bacterium]
MIRPVDHRALMEVWQQAQKQNNWPIFYFEDNIVDWAEAIERALLETGTPFTKDGIASAVSDYQKAKDESPEDLRISKEERETVSHDLIEFVHALAAKFANPGLDRLLVPLAGPSLADNVVLPRNCG